MTVERAADVREAVAEDAIMASTIEVSAYNTCAAVEENEK